MPITKRRELGDSGEKVAESFLRDKGYTIITRNHRIGNIGEIDIIARKSSEYIFVEVKTRDVSHETDYPVQYSIDRRKREAMKRTCELYLKERGEDGVNWRVDGVFILVNKTSGGIAGIEHMENILWDGYY